MGAGINTVDAVSFAGEGSIGCLPRILPAGVGRSRNLQTAGSCKPAAAVFDDRTAPVLDAHLARRENALYSGCQKNVPIAGGFLGTPLVPPAFFPEHVYDKRYKL
jgi:hypothetical protein